MATGDLDTKIEIHQNKKELAWEVTVDFGKFGKLFDDYESSHEFADEMRGCRLTLESRFRLVERLGMKRLR